MYDSKCDAIVWDRACKCMFLSSLIEFQYVESASSNPLW